MLWALLTLITASAQENCPPGTDCDGDGYTLEQGDCNEGDPNVHPGEPENCGNELDDDCDGLFNEGCDRSVHQGQLGGGSTCTAVESASGPGDTGLALLLPIPLFGWMRRRRARR